MSFNITPDMMFDVTPPSTTPPTEKGWYYAKIEDLPLGCIEVLEEIDEDNTAAHEVICRIPGLGYQSVNHPYITWYGKISMPNII